MLQRRVIDNSQEEKILIGMIVSDRYFKSIVNIVKKEYFIIPWVKIVSKWCIDYYKLYKKAPLGDIQNIFNAESLKLKEEEINIISAFLLKLSNQYENDLFNVEYLLDGTIKYFKKRSLKVMVDNIDILLSLNKIDEAQNEIVKHKEIRKSIKNWVNPLEVNNLNKFFEDQKNKTSVLFKLPGKLGDMIGDFERDTLLGILAPAKRGKTFWIQEIAIQAFLEKCKVVFISLEMSKNKIQGRMYKRFTALGKEHKDYVYPTFDCLKNQIDACDKKCHKNKIRLLNSDNKKPDTFDFNFNYRVCTECRGTKDFEISTWFKVENREKFKSSKVTSIIHSIEKMYGKNFRLFSYPAFSANISMIKNDLDDLEELENFVPDIICIDYADILAPEDSRIIGRERVDETWKTLKNLANTKHCLVVTASQSNRASFTKKNVVQTDISEDIRKIAHADSMLSLNQLPREKRDGIIRIAMVADRDGSFDEYKTCIVLQQLDLGQVLLDSEFVENSFFNLNNKENEDSAII